MPRGVYERKPESKRSNNRTKRICEGCGDEFQSVSSLLCYVCNRGTYVPTPEEIRERADAIKHGWTESEEKNRRGIMGREDVAYVVPTVREYARN